MTPLEIIESIQKDRRSAGDSNLRTIAAAIDRLQKAFPRYGSFLMEFIQNADDAKSTKIKIELNGRTVLVSNDGEPFTEANVRSICDVGGSSKSPEDYIGYLGVGFKSVFIVSDFTRIASGDFRFKFDKRQSPNPKTFPWQIVPHWIDSEANLENDFNTTFAFDIKDPNLIEKIREEFTPDHLSERILLFLRHVTHILIIDRDKAYERELQKSEVSHSDVYTIYRITQRVGQARPSFTDWLTFRQAFDAPAEVSNDSVTIDWERQTIRKREVVVAFRLSEDRRLLPEPKGTAHIGVFSFLPLKEIQSGLKFLIQADFLTAPGRGELARDCQWNEWLVKCAYRVIVEKCIAAFIQDDLWKFNYSSILTSEETGHELFKRHLTMPLESYLQNNLKLVAEDGTMIPAAQAIAISEPIRSLFDETDLQQLFPDKRLTHKDCKYIDHDGILTLESEPRSFLSSENGLTLLRRKATSHLVDWFKALYSLVVSHYGDSYFTRNYPHYNVEHDRFWDHMHDFSPPIVLTDNYELCKLSECFTNPHQLTIPPLLQNKPRIVHPDLSTDEAFRKLLHKLNQDRRNYSIPEVKVVPELTDLELRNRIFKEEVETLDESKWAGYTDTEKIEKLKSLKHLFTKKLISVDELKAKLSLKSKSNAWLSPENLVFGSEYQPKHGLESVVSRGLYDQEIHFLAGDYLESTDLNHIREWRDFFVALGVDQRLGKVEDKRDIVERVAVLSTLKYEQSKGKNPQERDASAEKVGWDIDSGGRKIEVKGTADPSSFDVLLSKNEQRAFFKEEDYFIYVVTDALSSPKLSVLNGKALRDSIDESVRLLFEYKFWNETTNAKIEEHQF